MRQTDQFYRGLDLFIQAFDMVQATQHVGTETPAAASQDGNHGVLAHGQRLEQLVDLIAFAHAKLAHGGYADAGDFLATEKHLSLRGGQRSEARRVGKESVSTCRSRR